MKIKLINKLKKWWRQIKHSAPPKTNNHHHLSTTNNLRLASLSRKNKTTTTPSYPSPLRRVVYLQPHLCSLVIFLPKEWTNPPDSCSSQPSVASVALLPPQGWAPSLSLDSIRTESTIRKSWKMTNLWSVPQPTGPINQINYVSPHPTPPKVILGPRTNQSSGRCSIC